MVIWRKTLLLATLTLCSATLAQAQLAGSRSFSREGRFELTPLFFVRVGYENGQLNIDVVDGQHMMRIELGFLN